MSNDAKDLLTETQRQFVEGYRDSLDPSSIAGELLKVIDRLAPKPPPAKSAGEREAEENIRAVSNGIELNGESRFFLGIPSCYETNLRRWCAAAIDRHRAEVEAKWADPVRAFFEDRDSTRLLLSASQAKAVDRIHRLLDHRE